MVLTSGGSGGGSDNDGGRERRPVAPPPTKKDEEDVPLGLRRFYGGNWAETSRTLDAAYTLVGGILGLGLVGFLVDRYFKTGPAGVLIGILVGFLAGFVRLGIVMLKRR